MALGGERIGLERRAAEVGLAAAEQHAAAEPQPVGAERQVVRDADDPLLVPVERVVEADAGAVAEAEQVVRGQRDEAALAPGRARAEVLSADDQLERAAHDHHVADHFARLPPGRAQHQPHVEARQVLEQQQVPLGLAGVEPLARRQLFEVGGDQALAVAGIAAQLHFDQPRGEHVHPHRAAGLDPLRRDLHRGEIAEAAQDRRRRGRAPRTAPRPACSCPARSRHAGSSTLAGNARQAGEFDGRESDAGARRRPGRRAGRGRARCRLRR